jgi:hypothetical protein
MAGRGGAKGEGRRNKGDGEEKERGLCDGAGLMGRRRLEEEARLGQTPLPA